MELSNEARERVVDQMKRIFDHLGYAYTDIALNKIIDVWFENKGPLIKLLSKHPNYVSDKFMIQFDHDFEREIDKSSLSKLHDNLFTADVCTELVEKANETYKKRLEVEQNVFMPSSFVKFLELTAEYDKNIVDQDFAEECKNLFGDYLNVTITEGMKTSRAVNRICVAMGIDKVGIYNKIFASYADAISPLKIKRHTVISCNPIDYLLMSNGNSWTSCHTINKFSKSDNNYGGCHASGTISYMLDATSLVYYEVSAEYGGNEIEMEPKIIRQMYHFGHNALVQGRLYPQSHDSGSSSLYEEKRNLVQKIFADILEVPNRWILKKGTAACQKIINHEGTHYHDTSHFDNCNVSYVRGEEKEDITIVVGHDPICIECGYEHSDAEQINCCHEPSKDTYVETVNKTPINRGTILK